MKTVKTPTGKYVLQPKLIYCYRSVIDSLKEMVKRKNFDEQCEEWRNQTSFACQFSDVYDGEIWVEFLTHNGTPFLSVPFNYAFHLNVDWFQPFEHTHHSEGVIYLSVFNIPRKESFQQHKS